MIVRAAEQRLRQQYIGSNGSRSSILAAMAVAAVVAVTAATTAVLAVTAAGELYTQLLCVTHW